MEHLNSILIEGNVISGPGEVVLDDKNTICQFAIISKSKVGNKEIRTHVGIKVRGEQVEYCRRKIRGGISVRVVGKLRRNNTPSETIYIESEHVECRPEYKAGNGDQS